MKIKKDWIIVGLFSILGAITQIGTVVSTDKINEKNANELDDRVKKLVDKRLSEKDKPEDKK